MQVFPITPVIFALWAIMVVRETDRALATAICLLPFGMLAAVALPAMGGLSLMGTQLVAALTIAIITATAAVALMRGEDQHIPVEAIPLALYAAYGLISATLLVRLFEGEFSVFSLSRGEVGAQISIFFRSTLVPLRPGNSNLAQAGYILISFAFFLAAWGMLRRKGALYGERLLVIVALINAALGVLDLLGLDPVLSVVRTATYSLANEQVSAGLPRIVGGYPEPSSFGGFTAILFGFFAAAFVTSGRQLHGVLALLSLAFALASLAASAFIALAGASIVIAIQAPRAALRPVARTTGLAGAAAVSLAVALACLVVVATPLPDMVERLINEILFDKVTSESGLERGAWAAYGLVAFRETFGLGAGVGSLRSNGLVSVILGSVGVPGALAFLIFLAMAFLRPVAPGCPTEIKAIHAGACAGAAAQLSAMLASATVPDPGLPLVFLAALATVSRTAAARPQASAGDPWSAGERGREGGAATVGKDDRFDQKRPQN